MDSTVYTSWSNSIVLHQSTKSLFTNMIHLKITKRNVGSHCAHFWPKNSRNGNIYIYILNVHIFVDTDFLLDL